MTHLIMEVKKSHNLLSASWRPGRTGGVVQKPEHGKGLGLGLSRALSRHAQGPGSVPSTGKVLEPEGPWCRFQSESEGVRIRGTEGRRQRIQLSEARSIQPFSGLCIYVCIYFCSNLFFKRLADAHWHWEGISALSSLPVQMLNYFWKHPH